MFFPRLFHGLPSEEQARLVREEAERERQRVQEEQEQLAREEAEQQMREEEEARIAELEEIRRQAAEEERHRGSASDAQAILEDSFAADFDLQVIEVSDVDEVPKECDSRTDGPKIDLPGPTVEVLESWSEEASSSSDFEASPEKDHAKAEGCRRATSVSGVLSYSVAEPEAELANAPSQEVPQPEVPQERQKQVEPPVADESPKPLKQPVGPSGQDQERKSKEVPTPSQAPVHQPTVAGNSSNAVPTVERIDTSASESNVDLAQPSNACQKAKVSVGTVVQEEQVRSAEAALRCTELASQSESKHDGGMMPVPVGAASYSAAHEAEAVLLANRSEAEVFASWRQEARRLGRATAARPFDEEESRARAEEADGEEEMERHSDVRSRTDEDGRRRRRLDWPRHSRSSSEEGQRAQAPRATGSASSHIRVEELAQSRVGSKQSSKGLKGQTPREREAFLLEDSPEASDLQKWTEDLRRWAQEVDVEDELPEASRDSATSRRNSWMKEAVEDSWRQSLAWEKSDPAQPCLADPKGVKEDEDSEDAASRHEAATRFVEAFKVGIPSHRLRTQPCR
ncbi:unnamed protein product [Durusdinium trenchii]|uniref:Uncharacterized protein n=2 Tax=Durusdinium trenchii TaxID=1381693 RepID=A0ABP0MEI0_9DINO